MRTFIAIEVPCDFGDELAHLSRQLACTVPGRFMRRETYHLTLAFLGERGEMESHLVIEAMDEVAGDGRLLGLAPTGLGTFGKPADCTVWLGISPAPELMGMAADLRRALTERGIAFDTKPFRPHITLVRRAKLPRGALPALDFPAPAQAQYMTHALRGGRNLQAALQRGPSFRELRDNGGSCCMTPMASRSVGCLIYGA